MTTPTTPEQARHVAQNMDFDVGVSDAPGMLLSLAQQVEELTAEITQRKAHWFETLTKCEALTTERDECLTLANEAKPLIEKLIAERDALKPDAKRYQWLRNLTRGHRGACFDQMWFLLPDVKRIPGQNIMQGSVAQHLDAAIDAAMKAAS